MSPASEVPIGRFTEQEAQDWSRAVLGALVDDDAPVLDRLLTRTFEPCAANYRLVLTLLPGMSAVVLKGLTENEASFAVPRFGPNATDATFFAGRILATAVNADRDTNQDLITALLTRVETDPDAEAGSRLLVDTVLALLGILRILLHALRDKAHATTGGAR